MSFKNFRDVVEKKFKTMTKNELFITSATRDDVWEQYLDAFPEGTNNLFKEKREYDCSTCRRFLKNIGNVVAINGNNQLVSVWDIEVDGYYQEVADALSVYVKSFAVADIFLHKEAQIAEPTSNQLLENGAVQKWNHFSVVLPSKLVSSDVVAKKGKEREAKGVFQRGIALFSTNSLEIVLDLIAQKSLYRGEEFQKPLKDFLRLKKGYEALPTKEDRDNFLWLNVKNRASLLKNTVIGSLVEDLSKGEEIENAVRAFESKVAPANYKRSSAPVSSGMVKNAVKKIDELGLETSLHRRFAVAKDVSINNVLFADRSTSAMMKDSLLSKLMKEVKPSTKSYEKIEEISIEDFIENVVPKVNSIELLLEKRHKSNLVSVIAPNIDAPKNIFAWDNPFSWSYNGDITDSSIKERVKQAGGSVLGDLRVSLSWFNTDDLDIHLKEPDGVKVDFTSKQSKKSGATLDVDMNVNHPVRDAVENITWVNRSRIKKGKHSISVNNYTSRESTNVGFEIEVEYLGEVYNFSYSRKIKQSDTLKVFDFEIINGKIFFTDKGKKVNSNSLSQEIWNIKTGAFQKVSMLMLSPNHWDENEAGNKHHFFVIDGCKNPEKARGFYNEFLRSDLIPHRKVFELLADQMKCESSSEQLSGLGFSSTKRDEIICKVDGNFSRVLKIKF